jgi:hypothetical protein
MSSIFVDAVAYGARLDCKGVKDAAVSGGALSTVTSATAGFTSSDTGKTYTLKTSAGAVTTGTLTFVNSTTCTMSTAAGGAITTGWLIYGTDDTTAWQDALDAATPGQIVSAAMLAFRTLCAGQLTIPAGVHLGFEGLGPFSPNSNPAMNDWGPTFVVIQSASTAFLTLSIQAGVGDLIFYSANQVRNTAPTATAYAPFIDIPNSFGVSTAGVIGCRIGKVYMPNAFNGVSLTGGNHLVEDVRGSFFNYGIQVDYNWDVIRIRSFHQWIFHRVCEGESWGPTAGTLDEYQMVNGDGIIAYHADGLEIGDIFVYGAKLAFFSGQSPDTGQSPRKGYGQIDRIQIDQCKYGVYIESSANKGWLVNSLLAAGSTYTIGSVVTGQAAVTTAPGSTPSVVVKSWGLWGTWASNSSNGGGTLIVPATNPG